MTANDRTSTIGRSVASAFLLTLFGFASAPAQACAPIRGDLVITDIGERSIVAIDADTGAACTVTQGDLLELPMGLSFAENGDLIVADANAVGGDGAVIRVDLGSGRQELVSSGGHFVDPAAVAVGHGAIYVADPNAFGGNGGIIRVDPVSGRQTAVSSGGMFEQPIGLTIGRNGRLYVTDREAPAVLRVNLRTGTQMLVGRRGDLGNPIGIAMGGDRAVYVTDADAFGGVSGAIFRVDTRTGKRTLVASGDAFISPVAIVMAGDRLFVVDYSAMIVVDPVTGEYASHPWGDGIVAPWAIAVAP